MAPPINDSLPRLQFQCQKRGRGRYQQRQSVRTTCINLFRYSRSIEKTGYRYFPDLNQDITQLSSVIATPKRSHIMQSKLPLTSDSVLIPSRWKEGLWTSEPTGQGPTPYAWIDPNRFAELCSSETRRTYIRPVIVAQRVPEHCGYFDKLSSKVGKKCQLAYWVSWKMQTPQSSFVPAWAWNSRWGYWSCRLAGWLMAWWCGTGYEVKAPLATMRQTEMVILRN